MLQLQSKKLDICRISKVLVKYNVKASIVNDVITLDGDISDDLISNLLDGIDIHIVRNFMDEMPVNVQN